jgi:hypothetical protein
MLSSFVQSHVENERKIITLLSDLWRHLPFAPAMDNGQLIVLGDPYIELYRLEAVEFGLLERQQCVLWLEATSVAGHYHWTVL